MQTFLSIERLPFGLDRRVFHVDFPVLGVEIVGVGLQQAFSLGSVVQGFQHILGQTVDRGHLFQNGVSASEVYLCFVSGLQVLHVAKHPTNRKAVRRIQILKVGVDKHRRLGVCELRKRWLHMPRR